MSGPVPRLAPAGRPVRRPDPSRRPAPPRARLLVRTLEERLVPTPYVVSNAASDGAGSLRQAVLDANASPGADSITFDPALFAGGPVTILTSGVPTITGDLTIAGPGS